MITEKSVPAYICSVRLRRPSLIPFDEEICSLSLLIEFALRVSTSPITLTLTHLDPDMKPSSEDEAEKEAEDPTKDGDERASTPPSCRGVSIEVPTINPSQEPPLQETPVAALRRYLDTIPQHPSAKAELKSGAVWRGVRSEVVASFLLTVMSAGASMRPLSSVLNHPRILSSSTNDYYLSEPESQDSMGFGWGAEWAIGHGLTLGALTWAIRSAHFSISTTLALFVSRKISVLRAGLHALAQIFGALAATPVLLGLLPRPPRAPSLSPSLSAAQGWGAEFLATVLVSLISLSSYESPLTMTRVNTNQQGNNNVEDSFTPRISHGALLPLVTAHISAALFTAGFTGIGLNPARSLALATLTGSWKNHWVWWVGPALGGLLAAFTHEYTGARDPRVVQTNIGGPSPQPSIVPVARDSSRPSFISSTPASPAY